MHTTGPTLRYGGLNAAYWASFCLIIAFSSVFLLARGLTNAQIGVTLAASGLLSAALQPVVAGAAGRSRRPLRWWIAALAVVMAAAAAALLVVRGPAASAVLFGFLMGTIQVALPLVNAVGMAAAWDGVEVLFGPARALGSLTFAATSSGVGVLVATTDADVIPVLVVAALGALVVASLTFVFRPGHRPAARAAAPPPPDAPPLTPARARRFSLLLVGMTGGFVSHAAINSFLFQTVRYHGGDASHMGLAFLVGATAEAVPMLFFGRIVARWRPDTLLRFAAMALAVKAVATFLAPNLTFFLLTMLLQTAAYALLIPASVYYVDRLLPVAERVAGQARMTLTATLGAVVAGLGGGVLLDAVGVPALLGAGAVAAIVSVGAVVAGTEPV